MIAAPQESLKTLTVVRNMSSGPVDRQHEADDEIDVAVRAAPPTPAR